MTSKNMLNRACSSLNKTRGHYIKNVESIKSKFSNKQSYVIRIETLCIDEFSANETFYELQIWLVTIYEVTDIEWKKLNDF